MKMTSASSPRLVALDTWQGDYPEAPLRSVHAFASEDAFNRYMEHPHGFVTIDAERANQTIAHIAHGEYGITTYGDFTASDLDAICHLDGFTWRPWLREAQDAMGTKRMVWVLVSDDPRNSDHVIYADKVANW